MWRSHDGRPLPLLDPDLTPLPVAPYGTPRIRLFDEAELLEDTTERDPSIIKLIMKKPPSRIRHNTLPMWRIPAPQQASEQRASEPERAPAPVMLTRKKPERPIESPIHRASSRHKEREALSRVIAMAKPRTRPGFTPRHRYPRPVTER